jgi:peptidoglycan LD-endopeptidase LytH
MKSMHFQNALNQISTQPIVKLDLSNILVFNFTSQNQDLYTIGINNTQEFTNYVTNAMRKANALVGYGKYNENRTFYSGFELFGSDRTVHMGIDLWLPAHTPIFAPLAGTVHSFKNNDQEGNYGPTLILKHKIDGFDFHTLFGHLSKTTLENFEKGQKIVAGQQLGTVGTLEENGNWPPHLHFQIIRDIEGHSGDYPGVCTIEDREKFLTNCPDPNLLLRIKVD